MSSPAARMHAYFWIMPPLRLLVKWPVGIVSANSNTPTSSPNRKPIPPGSPNMTLHGPVLRFNMVMDFLAAVFAFFLTRLWVRRGRRDKDDLEARNHFLGVWQGVVACIAHLVQSGNSHRAAYGWPTWDAWVIPLYLLTALLASLDLWFLSGSALAIAAMFKGQQLAVAPGLYSLAPAARGKSTKPSAGAPASALGMAVIASPWLLSYIPPDQLAHVQTAQDQLTAKRIMPDSYPTDMYAHLTRVKDWPAMFWIAGIAIMITAAAWLAKMGQYIAASAPTKAFLQKPKFWIAVSGFLVLLAVYWPWMLHRNRPTWIWGIILGLLLAAASVALSPRRLRYVIAAAVAAALLLCIQLFHGSHAWWDCGFYYGTIHYKWMEGGLADNLPAPVASAIRLVDGSDGASLYIACNLAALAERSSSNCAWWPAESIVVSCKVLFNTIYVVLLLLSGVAISLQARRNDRRMLIALVTPWVLFFMFPVEVHGSAISFTPPVSRPSALATALLMALARMVFHRRHLRSSYRCHDDSPREAASGPSAECLHAQFPRIFQPASGKRHLQIRRGDPSRPGLGHVRRNGSIPLHEPGPQPPPAKAAGIAH